MVNTILIDRIRQTVNTESQSWKTR